MQTWKIRSIFLRDFFEIRIFNDKIPFCHQLILNVKRPSDEWFEFLNIYHYDAKLHAYHTLKYGTSQFLFKRKLHEIIDT